MAQLELVPAKDKPGAFQLPPSLAAFNLMFVDREAHLAPKIGRYYDPPLCGRDVSLAQQARRKDFGLPSIGICGECLRLAQANG